jgi:hypothetical protein
MSINSRRVKAYLRTITVLASAASAVLQLINVYRRQQGR